MKISKIITYCDPQIAKEIDILQLEKFVKKILPVQIKHDNRDIFCDNDNGDNGDNGDGDNNNNKQQQDKYSKKIKAARIHDIKKPPRYITGDTIQKAEPKIQTIDKDSDESIAIYDGFDLCNVASEIIYSDKTHATNITNTVKTQMQQYSTLHIIFTDLTVCTFDESDYKYHARMLVGANPYIISTSGIVNGPARPREYYIRQMTKIFTEHTNNTKHNTVYNIANDEHTCYSTQDTLQNTLQNTNNCNYITRHDLRIPFIVQGLLLQAVTYYETGEAFCTDKSCRLYNAHWQSEMIHTQITSQKLCSKHQNVIKNMQDVTK